MEESHDHPLSFDEILALQHAEGLTDYAAWRRAIIQYNQQRGEHEATTPTAATTSPEIPLGQSVLTSKTAIPPGAPNVHLNQLPVNAAGENHILAACKPDDAHAKERVRENTERLVDSGIANKLCNDRTLDASLFERTEISDIHETTETKRKRVHEAHALYWDAMAAADKVIGKHF
ncbi:hypothetical protein N7471_009059 [Penicillium samsonianum]|uniref:uncharacterized protein n=1 Tax=Penicillium samsonianum TaxID=1882272 RepID=UPI002546B980|nr:uncharacterized protein N7471_009059 [Penicillium samsonianum]KAJ6127842.1 hypothetical protein N7471_009059 [Penicillium samsonianum]